MQINLDSIKQARLESQPYPHCLIKNFITADDAKQLINISPKLGNYYSNRQEGSDKTYSVQNNILYDLNNGHFDLAAPWDRLVQQLTACDYKEAISLLLGKDVRQSPMEITFKKYSHNDYISPHTDRDRVHCTHLIFFNESWQAQWGGNLQMLDGSMTVLKEVLPLVEHSFFFERTDQSWHAVSRCTNENAIRYALQVVFWKTLDKLKLPGRTEELIL